MAVIVGISLYADISRLGRALSRFAWWVLAPVVALTLANYALRFVKWHYLLRRAGAPVPLGRSAAVFVAGLSMAITPGKVGELLKSYLIRSTDAVPVAQSAPVVVAERITDLIALLLLSLGGMFVYTTRPGLQIALVAVALVLLAMSLLLASRRGMALVTQVVARLPVLRRWAPRLAPFSESMASLLTATPLLWTAVLSLLAWLCEGAGFYLVLTALPDTDPTLPLAVFIYATTTVLGAISFLPGGLGVTEGSMAVLLVRTGAAASRSVAVAATILIRLCTLWFAVAVGFITLAVFRRRVGLTMAAAGADAHQQ